MTESQGGNTVVRADSDYRDSETRYRDESIAYRLSGGALVREQNGRSETIVTGDTAVVVTDHRLQFVADTPIVDLPQTDIQNITIDNGLLRKTKLVVTDWDDTTYRLAVRGDVSDAVAYVERVSDCWQFVETLRAELDGQTATITTHIENEAFAQAEDVLSAAEETVAELEQRVIDAGLETALGPQVLSASRDVQRARLRGRLRRARELADKAEAFHTDGNREYDRAHRCYRRAREHLAAARSLAAEHDLDTVQIDDEEDLLDHGMAMLLAQPRTRAEQAVRRAVGADSKTRAEAYAEALSHYHDALTLGWGTDRHEDCEHLRLCVELAATAAVRAYRDAANELNYEGDRFVMSGETERGCRCYKEAQAMLDDAIALAREFRGPDSAPLRRRREYFTAKYRKIDV